jgi:hypothetical protein
MTKWFCDKCNKEMEEALLSVYYLGVYGTIEGIRCPKCRTCYVPEDIAIGKLARAERSIEEK